MGLAIVAIPEEQDRVWKFSSEKVPHLTLLFLGDEASADTQQIVQFVEHATQLSEHGPFYLDVESRGELGEDNADVLFFSKRSWNLKWIKQFRGQLLQNDAVRTAYDSAEQFGAPQDWLPHLTMGYPATPAKPQDGDNEYPFYSVCFDRIAVWLGDFDGPEFKLEWPDRPEQLDGPLAVAWADEQKKALTHSIAAQPKEKSETIEEQPVEEPERSVAEHGAAFVEGLVHGTVEDGEKFILEHYGVKGMRWGQRNSARGGVAGNLAGGVTGKMTVSRSGTIRAKAMQAKADQHRQKARVFEKAAEKSRPTRAHALRAKAEAHHKKADSFEKAAKSGHKPEPEAVATSATSKVPQGNRRKTKIKAEGGQNHPAHEDAIKVAEAKTKLKKSGPSALSNRELQEVATRVRLEEQVKVLTSHKAKLFVRNQLRTEGQNLAREGVKKGAKKVGTAALLAPVGA